MEYESVRILCCPLALCVKMEKSASKSSFALLTGTSSVSQSPAEVSGTALRPFSLNHSLTAETDSAFGATNASACRATMRRMTTTSGCLMAHLFLREMLSVVCAGRRADVVEGVDQPSVIAVDECKTQFEGRISGCSTVSGEADRYALASFMYLHAPSHGLAKGKCAERSDDERAEDHHLCSSCNRGV